MGNIQLTYRCLLSAFLLSVASIAFGQAPLTDRAVALYQEGDLMAARDAALEAVQSPEERETAYAWFVKGFVFKEIYKQIEKANPYSENREVAVESIKMSMQLDSIGEYTDNNQKALTFIATTYYNDAVKLTKSLSFDNLEEPEKFYAKYKTIDALVEPNKSYAKQDVEMFMNLAKGNRLLYEKDMEKNTAYFDNVVDYYKKALELNPEEYSANHNLAINLYNRGVYKIRKINHNTEIFELMAIQEECVTYFKKSLPYMLKANELNKNREETVKGLMAIYRSLSDDEQAMIYETQLDIILNEGGK
ncbi:MAG: hypothetical protein P8H59_12480 [Flavobacteriales bacterium]|nr:hypothetical protein [Flavobacteriales bacterium]MDG1781765.1 hypothetical protein [Flavobacteriales bacterium]MDG2246005.1 hypothetical protein [Flavobacteriales bacterium]